MAKRTKHKQTKKPKAPKHLDARVKLFQSRLRADRIAGVLLSNPKDIRYLTGFVGDDSWCWVPARGSGLVVISDMRFFDHIPQEAPHVGVCMRGMGKGKKGRQSLADAAAGLPAIRRAEKIGVQAPHLNVPTRKQIAKAIGARRVKDYDDKLLTQRSVKDAGEIKKIREAVRIQQLAFTEVRDYIRVGMTELEVCAYLEYRMRCHGADGPGFNTIVAFDGHASHSHAIPGPAKLKKNSSVLIDWGACYQGYTSDMTRVLNVGKPKKHIAEIYKMVEEAMHAGIDAVGPGVSLKEVDDASRDVLKKHGHKLVHGLGHGIGLNVHEQPGISQDEKTVLKPGQVITIEPGIYLGDKGPKAGGVRLEDDILVTAKGAKNLSDLPTALDWTII